MDPPSEYNINIIDCKNDYVNAKDHSLNYVTCKIYKKVYKKISLAVRLDYDYYM